jgi:hypothetical protein
VATYRLPGPTCAAEQTLLIDDGTLQLSPGSRPGPLDGAVPGHASNRDPRTLWRRAEAVREACAIALVHAPEAIVRATGLDDLPRLLHGMLDGVIGLLAFVAAGALLGGAVGGVLGAVFGGVGALPGAALGAQLGTDAAVAVLGWLGLAFLVTAVGRGLGEVTGKVTLAVGQAWDAEGRPQRQREVELAGQLLADAVGQLVLLIVLAVVARLTAAQASSATARTAGSAEELYAALRASRLGAGFADWVQANEARLLANPRLRMHNEVAGTGAKAAETVTPSQLRSSRLPNAPSAGSVVESSVQKADNDIAGGAAAKGLANQNPLYKAAVQRFKNSDLSNAGRALTKHPELVGETKETLRQVLRSEAAVNDAAHAALQDIMRNGVVTTPTLGRYGTVTQIQIPGGFGARWGVDGNFIGFINP